jgi:CheY-like chemotaxis protein
MASTDHAAPVALVVAEDAETRHLASTLFEESELSVVECESGEAALSALHRLGEEAALVFASVPLPGLIDGIDLARLIRTHWPRVNVIVTSDNPADARRLLPDGAVYMAKPWRALDVLMAAERAVPRSERV